MTSHPSIDLFIVVLVELLTRGNWASPCVHVPQCVVGWGVEGVERRDAGTKVADGQQATGICW